MEGGGGHLLLVLGKLIQAPDSDECTLGPCHWQLMKRAESYYLGEFTCCYVSGLKVLCYNSNL